jgi:hypothetical protein
MRQNGSGFSAEPNNNRRRREQGCANNKQQVPAVVLLQNKISGSSTGKKRSIETECAWDMRWAVLVWFFARVVVFSEPACVFYNRLTKRTKDQNWL